MNIKIMPYEMQTAQVYRALYKWLIFVKYLYWVIDEKTINNCKGMIESSCLLRWGGKEVI